jgi:type I restriction enzyme, S subunit
MTRKPPKAYKGAISPDSARMRNKPKATTVKAGGKSALLPKLRFPQFRDAAGWEERNFDEVLTPIVRERKKPNEAYTGLGLRSHGKGTFLKKLEDPKKNAMEYLYEVKCNDLIVNITFAWEGAVAIAGPCDNGALVSHRFPTYTFEKGKASHEFFRYIILDKQFVYKLGVMSPGGAGRNRVLSKSDFLKLQVLLPDTEEQQKIAECLGSADELIAAQARKLDALKTHKKALMQRLFPREGETQPSLRFPEFKSAGEWEEKKLDQLVDIQSGATPSKENPAFWNGTVPWVSAKDMKQLFLADAEDHISASAIDDGARLVPPGTILVLTRGMTLLKDVPICVLRREMSFNQDVKGLRPKHGVEGVFLACMLIGNKQRLLAMVDIAGHGTGKLDTGELKALDLMLPSPAEQQRIADCLTTFDDLIAAHTQKLDALKTHKKGLMQQLFPSPEEVEA